MNDRAGDDARKTVEQTLETAREMLGMDIAYLSRFDDGVQRVRDADGDTESFGLTPGTEIVLADSYCQRMVNGEIPSAICDASHAPVVSQLDVTTDAGIAAYLGVPVVLSDGALYGTLCCADHEAKSLGDREVRFLELLAKLVAQAVEREDEAARQSQMRVQAAALSALLASLEARDAYTGDHSVSVVELATACARRLRCSEPEIADLRQVALLHDIGKVGVPDSILRKPGKLSDEEWKVMRRHPEIGAEIVGAVESLRHLAPAVRAEHERFDGAGYPDGLAGTDIPLASRIVLACDAYHAMVSDRPYRRALPRTVAAGELAAGAGSQFDPGVVDALLSVLGDERVSATATLPTSRPGDLDPAAVLGHQDRPARSITPSY